MTETATVFIQSSEHDTQVGTTGSLLPAAKARIVDPDGKEITEYEKPGELLIQSPTVSLGYFNNPKATAETFFEDADGRWIRTGDEVLVRISESGNEHFVVVDRVKELIKVKVRDRCNVCAYLTVTDYKSRAIKSRRQSWSPIFSPIPP